MLWGGRWEGGSCLGTHIRIKDFKIYKKQKIKKKKKESGGKKKKKSQIDSMLESFFFKVEIQSFIRYQL